ncbi:MAG: hypothetical protein ABIF12_02720 [bacterium]
MQKGFCKKLIIFFLTFSFLSNYASSYQEDNYFFKKAFAMINNLDLYQGDIPNKQSEYKVNTSFTKEIGCLLKKISAYDFSLKSMAYSNLISLFNHVDNQMINVLENKSFFPEQELNDYLEILDFLKNGIYYEVSFKHILELKKFIIKNLDEIINLIDYWKFKLSHKVLQDKLEELFKKKDEKIVLKLKDLNYLKIRMSSFLGKIEELEIRNSLLLGNNQDDNDAFEQIETVTRESIFCINSFFSSVFDTDNFEYKIKSLDFSDNFSTQSFKKFLSNHMNILLLEDSFKYTLNDYKTPGFLRRNWLKLSVFSATTTVAGIYLYKNWDDITLKTSRIIDDSKTSLKDSYSSFIGMINTKFDLNIPGGTNLLVEDLAAPESFSQKIEENMQGFAETAGAFRASGQNFFGVGLDDNVNMQMMLDRMSDLRGQIDGSVQLVDGSVEELSQSLGLFTRNLNKSLVILGLGQPVDGIEGLDNLPQPKNVGLGFLGNRIVSTELRETAEGLLSRVDLLLRQLEYLRDSESDTRIRESLVAVAGQFNEMIPVFSKTMQDFSNYLKMYEGLAHGVIGVGLDSVYKIIISSVGEIDVWMNKFNGVAKDVQVTANWVKATVPVIITSIVIPLITILIIRKIFKNKTLQKQTEINDTLVNIYRILNINNKISQDVSMADLSYQDRGLLAFFVNSLNLKVGRLFKSGKEKLTDLVDDLNNQDFSVSQKLDFIKAAWSYNLFGASSLGVSSFGA